MNRLARESSPYLRQHAENPVDWYPWGEEALELARSTDRPILLSVGYSACHWCHVMEHESFSDPEVAELMNRWFVNVKVDREERPDVDGLYMRAVQAMTGRGGWPMTVCLKPSGEPFFGGTYFPPEPRHGMASFKQVLSGIHEAWDKRREDVDRAAAQLLGMLRQSTLEPEAVAGLDLEPGGAAEAAGPAASFNAVTRSAAKHLMQRFDSALGGIGGAPKFPQPVVWEFLLARSTVHGDPALMEACVTTLRAMARGGMRDHLGGAFHRYSVDQYWLVPHFEKMLYDNGLLLRLYVNAFQLTGDPEFERTAVEIADDLIRTFQLECGGFAAAWDADSEGVEGKFYVWSPDQVRAVLGAEAGERFCRTHDVTPGGNFEGESIPHVVGALEEMAAAEGVSADELLDEFRRSRALLHQARARRVPPLQDTKVVTSWNAMAIRGMAEAGAALGREDYVDAARRAADYLLRLHFVGDGPHSGLVRVSMDEDARITAFLEDWGALGNALLTLHEATLEPRWLEAAIDCCEGMVEGFLDRDTGMFFDAEADSELVVRPRDLTDSATPSGNSLAVELLLRLSHLTDRREWRELAERVLTRELGGAARFPGGFGRLLTQMERWSAVPMEIAIVGTPDQGRDALLGTVWAQFLPFRALTGAAAAVTSSPIPLLKDRAASMGRARAWVCRAYACDRPTDDPAALSESLRHPGRSS